MTSTKIILPTIEQMRLENKEIRERVVNAVRRAAAHRADKANWPDEVCTVCGHWGCIKNEGESCNWDSCGACNQAIGFSYCFKGQHEWTPGSPQRWCLFCQAWEVPEDEDEDW